MRLSSFGGLQPRGAFEVNHIFTHSLWNAGLHVMRIDHMATREGYSQLAWRMSTHPELAIVRRFQALNFQNLLYLQSELSDMEERFRKQEAVDRKSPSESRRWKARSWKFLQEGIEGDEDEGETWRMFLELRQKLKEYSMQVPASTSSVL